MRRSLEIPLGKRTPKYRFLEILPGAISYIGVILLFVLSFFSPILGAIYLIAVISTTLVKAAGIAYRTYGGFNTMKMAEKVIDAFYAFRDFSQKIFFIIYGYQN